MIKGTPASPGIAIGPAMVITKEEPLVRDVSLSESHVEAEVQRFALAVQNAKKEVLAVRKRVKKEIGEGQARIFDAHGFLLEDPALIDSTVKIIKEQKKNAEFALKSVVENAVASLNAIKDPYIRERTIDVHDVFHRLLDQLVSTRGTKRKLGKLTQSVILISQDFSPSEVAQMQKGNVLGFVTISGARESHGAIVARALEIPAVVGATKGIERIRTGDMLIVDGTTGTIIISPNAATIVRFEKRLQRYVEIERDLMRLRDVPAETLDGKQIELSANAELPVEVDSVLSHGACAIGLYRTEFLFLNRKHLPGEEEQFRAYRQMCERMAPRHIIMRTLDLGADKPSPSLSIGPEMNPAMGWRAIRICLERPALLETQLRAILRASVFGTVKILFPMISSLGELDQALAILRKVQQDLRKRKVKFAPNIPVGIMIETPGAVMTSEWLAERVDFFSIGSNDLIQFTLAVDRSNNHVAYLYDPIHPAVLRLIKLAVDAGHRKDIWVGVCGEMATNPLAAILLLGMGVDAFSVSPVSVLEIKRFFRSVSFDEIRKCTNYALTMSSSKEISAYIEEAFAPQLKEMRAKSISGAVH